MYSLYLKFVAAWALFGQSALSVSLPSAFLQRSEKQHEECDKRGAVASESSVCSRIGINLIREGGNAADAVGLLAVVCLSLVCCVVR